MWATAEKKPEPRAEDNFTFLSKGVNFKGVIHFDGIIRIDGRLEGEVHTSGTVIVSDSAVITGTVSAGTVVTSGKINGTVTATEKVQMLKPGVMIGDVRTPAISVEEGSHFHGLCDMGAQTWVENSGEASRNVYDLTTRRAKVSSQDS
jgi:cytoskeletal protein CcmA (bactofilin family)